jgi:hypothetical protein
MAQNPPIPNAANMNAAIAGMAQEGNAMVQSAQQYNTHQQALVAELALVGNFQTVQLQNQIQQMNTDMNNGFLAMRAE